MVMKCDKIKKCIKKYKNDWDCDADCEEDMQDFCIEKIDEKRRELSESHR